MNEQTSCSIVREKLPLYVGRDLDAEAQELVRSHLEECGDCARDAAVATRSRQAFQAYLAEFTGPASMRAQHRDFESPSEAAGSGTSLWDGVRAELVREGRIVRGNADEAPVSPSGDAPSPAGKLLTARFGSRLAAAAAAVIAVVFLGPRLLDGDPATPPGPQGIAGVTSGSEGVAPQLVGLTADPSALAPQESGMRPLLRNEPDLLRDARPLIFRVPAPSTSGGGASQLAGFSGGEPRGEPDGERREKRVPWR